MNTTFIDCKKCGRLRGCSIVTTVIMETTITSDVKCLACDTVHVITYDIARSVRKYARPDEHKTIFRPPFERGLGDDEQVENHFSWPNHRYAEEYHNGENGH